MTKWRMKMKAAETVSPPPTIEATVSYQFGGVLYKTQEAARNAKAEAALLEVFREIIEKRQNYTWGELTASNIVEKAAEVRAVLDDLLKDRT
jgi:hypothetical protein